MDDSPILIVYSTSGGLHGMTLVEAADLLGLRTATLRQQIANGRLRAKKVGRDWHISSREVERYERESLGHPGRRKSA